MRQYLIKRVLLMIPTLLGITIITFLIIKMAPGEPMQTSIMESKGGIDPRQFSREVRKAKRELIGLAATYEFTTITTDPDGDKIKYVFDWGDGSSDATPSIKSGEVAKFTHSWDPAGTYKVRVRAIDEKGATSAWSNFHSIKIEGNGNGKANQQDDITATLLTENNKPPNTPQKPSGASEGYVDTPIWQQYLTWLTNIVTWNFGEYYRTHELVINTIARRIPITILLSIISIFISYIIAVPLGVFSSTGKLPTIDKIITVILFILYSLPSFWVAVMLITYFSSKGAIINLPISGLYTIEGYDKLTFWGKVGDWSTHLILPVVCYTYGSLAQLSRYTRSGMMDVIRQDFIRTARAKGLSEKVVIFKHALRNGMIPVITLMASILPGLIGGSVIIERIFSIPGLGQLFYEAVLNREYNMVMAETTFVAILTLVGILLTDISYVIFDPRITFEKVSD